MEKTLPQRLQTYIKAELSDAALYRELAKIAPEGDRALLLEFAADEQAHAEEFKYLYRNLTRQIYSPVIVPPTLTEPYRAILLDRVLDESGDFRKYGEEYLAVSKDSELKKAFYRARTDEGVHAMRLLYLLAK